MDQFFNIAKYSRSTNEHYGTSDFAFYLYGLIKMVKPSMVIELGTGVGTTCFLAAQACKENNKGKIITVDNGQDYQHSHFDIDYDFDKNARDFDLHDFLELRKIDLDLKNLEIFNDIKQVDILFNDISCAPHHVLTLLSWILPRVNEECYFIIDRGATHWPTYCSIELILNQLNQGKIPKILMDLVYDKLHFKQLVQNFKFSVQYILKNVEPSDDQDSFAIIKIEENNIGYRMI